jgi:hypothetical protein
MKPLSILKHFKWNCYVKIVCAKQQETLSKLLFFKWQYIIIFDCLIPDSNKQPASQFTKILFQFKIVFRFASNFCFRRILH